MATAAAAYGQQANQGTGATQSGYDPNQVICQRIGETGSRLNRRRVCLTRAEWETRRRETKQGVDDAQNRRMWPGE
ncbi:hypothetical protein [Sphingosinicella terrae]|uniref:hypothetical protein n=1 Tax=Sphingosinicella terrae TaxID=2172047 RepID=UPI000E0E0263|nr:hypothetical protein [Sphingosinicella terrae]